MSKYIATVQFYKDVEEDNWHEGCVGDTYLIDSQTLRMEFTNQSDLLSKLGIWINNFWGVDEERFSKWVDNSCEVDRFEYDQHEDVDGNYVVIDEHKRPTGWLARYKFNVKNVVKVEDVDFQFTTIKD